MWNEWFTDQRLNKTLDDKLNKNLYGIDLKKATSKLQENINKLLKENEKELTRIYADRQLKKELTKWLEILKESGLDWEKIEINNHIIKIYNFKGENENGNN